MVTMYAVSVTTVFVFLIHGSTGYFMYVAAPPRAGTIMPKQHEFELNRSPYVSAPPRTVLHPAGFVSKPPRMQPAEARAETYRAAGPTYSPPPAEPRMVSSDHIRRKKPPPPPAPQPSHGYATEEPRLKKSHRKSSTVTDNEIAEMVAQMEAEKEQEQKLADILPRVTFECKGRAEGYYADMEFACEVFHYCGKPDGRRFTFFCPPGSRFNQIHMICDYDKFQGCDNSQDYYHLNEKLYPKEEVPEQQTENRIIPKPAPPPSSVPMPHRTHYSSPRPASIPLAPASQPMKHQASNKIIHSTLRPVKTKSYHRSPSNIQKQIIAARSSEEDAIMTPAPRKRHHQRNRGSPPPPQRLVSRDYPTEERRKPHGYMSPRPQIQGPLRPSGSHRSPVQVMVDDNDIGPMAGRFPHGDPRRPRPHHHPRHHHMHPHHPYPMHHHPPHPGFVEGRNEHSNEEFDSGFPGLPIAFQRGGTFGRPMPERHRPGPASFEPPHEHFRMAAGSQHHPHHHHRPPPFEYEEFDEPDFLPSPSALVQEKPQESHKTKPHPEPHPKHRPTPHSSHHPSTHSAHHSRPHSEHNRRPSSHNGGEPRVRHSPQPLNHNHISSTTEHHKRPTHHPKPMQPPRKHHRPRPVASDEVIKAESMRESFRSSPPPIPHRIRENSEHRRPQQPMKIRTESSKSTPTIRTAYQEHKPERSETWKPVLTTHRPHSRNHHRQQHTEKSTVSSRERHTDYPYIDEKAIEYTSNMEVRAKPQADHSPKPKMLKPYPNEDEWSVEKHVASTEAREEFARTKAVVKPGDVVKVTTHSTPLHNNRIRHEYKAAPTWDGKRTPVEPLASDEEPRLAETIETKRVTKLPDSSERPHGSKAPRPSARIRPTEPTKEVTSDNHVHRTRKPVASTSRNAAHRQIFKSTARTTTTIAPTSEDYSEEEEESSAPIATTSSTTPPTPAAAPTSAPAPKHFATHRGIQRKRIQSSSIGGRMNNWPLNNRPSYKGRQATTTQTPAPTASEETSSEEAETTTQTTSTTHRPRRTRPPFKNHHHSRRTRTRAPAIEPTENTPTSTVHTTPITPEQPEKLTQIHDDDDAGKQHLDSADFASDRLDAEEKSYIR